MAIATLLILQTLWSGHVEGAGPVRFGVPLPAATVARGLRLRAGPGARMQWSLLQSAPTPTSSRVWVEIALCGVHGRFAILAGGSGPAGEGGGAVVRHERRGIGGDPAGGDAGGRDAGGPAAGPGAATNPDAGAGATRRTESIWRWACGDDAVAAPVDWLRRTRALVAVSGVGSAGRRAARPAAAGEAHSTWSEQFLERCLRVAHGDRWWRKAGVLPPTRGVGRTVRDELLATLPHLRPAPGARGRGDYLRGAADRTVVTNLEFDTALGFARLGLATGDRECLRRAYQSARHLIDVDLDARSGLPFRHGREHRSAAPELGHVWLRGLLLTGCVFADRELIDAALGIGRALASRVRGAERPDRALEDRMRDVAWPLFEIEALLRFTDEPGLRAAADRLAAELLDRWDAGFAVFRFGEGETRGSAYRERCWLTGGILVPALRRYAARTGDPRVEACVRATETRLLSLLRAGRPGVPLRYLVGPRGVGSVTRRAGAPECYFVLEGLGARALRSALRRSGVRRALTGTLSSDHDDLATRFSIVARCDWVLQ